jgi:hypothetical protein
MKKNALCKINRPYIKVTTTNNILNLICLNWYSGGWSQLSPLGTAATNRLIVPAPGDYDGEFGAMIGRGNRSTLRKPAPVPLCTPQTPHAVRTRTRAAALESQRLTAWATARPTNNILNFWNRGSDFSSWARQFLYSQFCYQVSVTRPVP